MAGCFLREASELAERPPYWSGAYYDHPDVVKVAPPLVALPPQAASHAAKPNAAASSKGASLSSSWRPSSKILAEPPRQREYQQQLLLQHQPPPALALPAQSSEAHGGSSSSAPAPPPPLHGTHDRRRRGHDLRAPRRMSREMIAALRQCCVLLEHVSDEQLEALAARMQRRAYSAGQPVVEQGERSSAAPGDFFVVEAGRLLAERYASADEPQQAYVADAHPARGRRHGAPTRRPPTGRVTIGGEYGPLASFGLTGLLWECERAETVRAEASSTVWCLRRADLVAVLCPPPSGGSARVPAEMGAGEMGAAGLSPSPPPTSAPSGPDVVRQWQLPPLMPPRAVAEADRRLVGAARTGVHFVPGKVPDTALAATATATSYMDDLHVTAARVGSGGFLEAEVIANDGF